MDSKGIIYCLPGLGADYRLFNDFDPGPYNKICLSYSAPLKGESIHDYAIRLMSAYDLTKPYYLTGISLGGLMAAEIASTYPPRGVIFLSTIKNSGERPRYFGLGKKIPIPGFKYFKKWIPLGKHYFKNTIEYEFFKSMLENTSDEFGDWAVNEVIHWAFSKEINYPYIHINGSRDELFPPVLIQDAVQLKGGRHDMTLNRWHEINPLVSRWLSTLEA